MVEVSEETAAGRASAAAEALAAEGAAVTARAVRERSGVKMAVAADVAREWNRREQAKGQVPGVPDVLRTRFEAIWAEAVSIARAEHAAEREGWQQRLVQLEAERDGIADDLDKAEEVAAVAQADVLARLQEAEARAEQAASLAEKRSQLAAEQLAAERSRADRAEARADTLADERDRLIAERDRAIAQLEKTRTPKQ